METSRSRIRWKRVTLIAALLALSAGFVVTKPLLFPKPLPQVQPAAMPSIDIAYNEHYFDNELERYGAKCLGHQCNVSASDALQVVVHYPFSDEQVFLELYGNRLIKHVGQFHFNDARPQPNGVASSQTLVNANSQRSIWQLVDGLTVATPNDAPSANLDGPSVDLEACRHGHYIPSMAIGRTSGPERIAADMANELSRLTDGI